MVPKASQGLPRKHRSQTELQREIVKINHSVRIVSEARFAAIKMVA